MGVRLVSPPLLLHIGNLFIVLSPSDAQNRPPWREAGDNIRPYKVPLRGRSSAQGGVMIAVATAVVLWKMIKRKRPRTVPDDSKPGKRQNGPRFSEAVSLHLDCQLSIVNYPAFSPLMARLNALMATSIISGVGSLVVMRCKASPGARMMRVRALSYLAATRSNS